MTRAVAAPDGFEGTVYYVDGSHSWQPAYRRVGATWWTNTYHGAGHAYLTDDEVTKRAEAAIVHDISVREKR